MARPIIFSYALQEILVPCKKLTKLYLLTAHIDNVYLSQHNLFTKQTF